METVEIRLDLGALSKRLGQTPQQVSDTLYDLEKQHIVKIVERNYQLFIVIPRTVEIGLFLQDEAAISSETLGFGDCA